MVVSAAQKNDLIVMKTQMIQTFPWLEPFDLLIDGYKAVESL